LSLTPGTRIGVFQLIDLIGRGGMGEVYRATDTKLKRQVAIKILPPDLVADRDRLARFQREAEVLASLNHPNIAAIYGLEESEGMTALVMELVEGDDLSQRIARGAIPVDEALPISKQIAEALEAAHEQGIIHRDLKPANIKVRPDGTVKVLDFGLAKAMEPPAGSSPSMSMSPTITTPAMTQAGMILGTAAYMSPEQAKGRDADKRSDIWAFGAVLYEMLTGRRPFDGEDISDTLANVLKIDPDWSLLPAEIPPAMRTLLQGCLAKDRRRRVADISTALFVLDKGASLAPASGPPDPAYVLKDTAAAQATAAVTDAVSAARAALVQSTRRRVAIASAAAVLVGAVVAATVTWFATRPDAPVPPRVSRLTVTPSSAAALTINGTDRDLAITPDGSRIAYVGNGGTQLFVRALDALAPVVVYTGAPREPFVSPDGQWIGFVDSTLLRKVAVTGGPAVTVATVDGVARGATWGPDDAIVFGSLTQTTGLQRVGAGGGPPTVLTRPDRAQGEADHLWPEMLPGGRAVLFTITAVTGGLDAAQVAVLDLQTGMRKILVRGGSHAQYVPSGSGSSVRAERDGGHLVYAAAGTLRAVPFDLAGLETRGTPVPVVPDAVTTVFGAVDAVVAGDGTLAYVSGGVSGAQRTLTWVDRQGRETPIPAPTRGYIYPRLSPDGTRVAVHASDQEADLWLWDLARATLTRLTFDPGLDINPVWTPDGRRLLFSSDRSGGVRNTYEQAADGTGSATRVIESANNQDPTGTTPDGTRVLINEVTPTRGRDLRLLTLMPTPRVESLLETPFEERGGVVSPDGRWLAYESNSSGRFEIYVRPFPNVGDGQWQVSTAGGVQPLWARTGRELFYLAPEGALLTVPVDPRSTAWSAGSATKLTASGYFTGGPNVSRQYDASPDGQRFLMIKQGGTDQAAAPTQLIVVQHFDEELKRLAPTK